MLITGAVAVFAPQIYEWEFRDLVRLPAPAAFEPGVLSKAVDRGNALLAADGATVEFSRAVLPETPGHALRLIFWVTSENTNAFRLPAPWRSVSVFAHPASGEIRGVAADDRSLAEYLATLHIRIFAGTPGRNFVGIFGLSLLMLSISGLLILGRFLGKKALWLIRRDKARATHSDLHKLVGVVLLLPALLFAVTGFWLGLQGRLMTWFDIERPEVFERPPVIEPALDRALPLDLPALLAVAKNHHPNLIPETITWSTDGQRSVSIYGRVEPMIYERQSHGLVLDKADRSVLHLNNAAQGNWKEKLFYLQEGLHFGEWGGMPVRWIYFAVGLLLAAMPVTGFAIQLLRTRRSLRPLASWTLFACVGSAALLAVVKTMGYAAANAYGTILLWTVVTSLIGRWVLGRKRRAA